MGRIVEKPARVVNRRTIRLHSAEFHPFKSFQTFQSFKPLKPPLLFSALHLLKNHAVQYSENREKALQLGLDIASGKLQDESEFNAIQNFRSQLLQS
jgi:hypothetical protein